MSAAERLRKLGELRDAGTISNAGFEQQRERILDEL